jgi:luciferase family oxidoreductase group 1
MRVSVLDQTPIPEGSTGPDALRSTLDLAQAADRFGYHRYWLAEHHGGTMLAGPSPEALIGPIAAATSRIRVGSGGVMLPHYSPLKVAETFSLLSGLYPDRIDLGLGRAPGSDPMTAQVLQRDRRQPPPEDDFFDQLAELIAYLEDRFPPGHPLKRLTALPGVPERPELWLLGSSPQSAIWAADLGLPYAFADFINARGGADISRVYRERFSDSERLFSPRVAVAVWAIAADTEEEAVRLSYSSRMAMALLRRGRLIAVPPVDKAERFLRSEGLLDKPLGDRRLVLGTPDAVRAELEEVAALYGAEEVIVVSITHDHAARVRSYELIADAFQLASRPRAA